MTDFESRPPREHWLLVPGIVLMLCIIGALFAALLAVDWKAGFDRVSARYEHLGAEPQTTCPEEKRRELNCPIMP